MRRYRFVVENAERAEISVAADGPWVEFAEASKLERQLADTRAILSDLLAERIRWAKHESASVPHLGDLPTHNALVLRWLETQWKSE